MLYYGIKLFSKFVEIGEVNHTWTDEVSNASTHILSEKYGWCHFHWEMSPKADETFLEISTRDSSSSLQHWSSKFGQNSLSTHIFREPTLSLSGIHFHFEWMKSTRVLESSGNVTERSRVMKCIQLTYLCPFFQLENQVTSRHFVCIS